MELSIDTASELASVALSESASSLSFTGSSSLRGASGEGTSSRSGMAATRLTGLFCRHAL